MVRLSKNSNGLIQILRNLYSFEHITVQSTNGRDMCQNINKYVHICSNMFICLQQSLDQLLLIFGKTEIVAG